MLRQSLVNWDKDENDDVLPDEMCLFIEPNTGLLGKIYYIYSVLYSFTSVSCKNNTTPLGSVRPS